MQQRLRLLTVCLMVFVFCMVSTAMAGDGGWRKWKEDDGIVGFERKVEGSKYLETKAETEVNIPMEVLLEVLTDIPNYPNWQYDCKEAKLIEKDGDLHRILYYNQNIPIIGQPDRWAVIDAKTIYNNGEGSCTTILESIDREYPRTDGQRMNKFSGKYELTMTSDRNHTFIRYTAFSDPAGFAPAFVAKGTIRKVTFNGVQNWIKMAQDPKYIKAAETGIAKPIIDNSIADGTHKFSKK